MDDGSGDHHFRKPANDITSQLEINFGDLGRPGRGRGGPRGGGRGGARGGGPTRAPRERRPDKVGRVIVFDREDTLCVSDYRDVSLNSCTILVNVFTQLCVFAGLE